MKRYNTRYREHMDSISKKPPSKSKSKANKSKSSNNNKASKSRYSMRDREEKKEEDFIENYETNHKKEISKSKKNNKLIIDEEDEENEKMNTDKNENNIDNENINENEEGNNNENIEENYIEEYENNRTVEEEKINEIFENASFFNKNLLRSRISLNKQFLKKKIAYSFLRDNKSQVFFNVPFFPKSEMFTNEQLNIKSNKNSKFKLNNPNPNIIPNTKNYQANTPTPSGYSNNNQNNNNINHNNSDNPLQDILAPIPFLDSSYINNQILVYNFTNPNYQKRTQNFTIFGTYRDSDNINETNNNHQNNQIRHRNIFSSIFPNRNQQQNKIIEIKEDDSESEENKKYKEKILNKEEHKIETFKKLAERYKENKEMLKNNIGERKFYLLK